MSEEFDPEVARDIQLREDSRRDFARTRGRGVYDWQPSPVVGKWKCRVPVCTNFVDVTEQAMETWALFNRELRRRGEAPIETSKVLYCPRCLAEYKRTAPDRRRGQVDRMGDGIRQLKASPDPSSEHELIKQLEQWGHPDVHGLLQILTAKPKKQTVKP